MVTGAFSLARYLVHVSHANAHWEAAEALEEIAPKAEARSYDYPFLALGTHCLCMCGAADYSFSWRDGIAYKRVAYYQANMKLQGSFG